VAIALLLVAVVLPFAPAGHASGSKLNVIFILTDDQRWDTLWAMPEVQSELVAKGMTFNDFFYTNPLCCPARAGILTGKSSRHTNCWWINNCFDNFKSQEAGDIAPFLQAHGYYTGLIGKYLNSYDSRNTTHVPPGWDRWVAETSTDAYYNETFSVDGRPVRYGSQSQDYVTTVLTNYADDLIRHRAPANKPLFLYLAVNAPHEPAKPPPDHKTEFSGLAPYRPPNFNEQDVSDKPAWVRDQPTLTSSDVQSLDNFRINEYRTLLGVDDAVKAILQDLAATGRTNNLIIFASDNGLAWGEHRMSEEKSNPYEEVIRGPLVARWDGVIPAGSIDDHFVLNVDMAPTWAAAAGAGLSGVDGTSLLPLFTQTATTWRSDFYVEHAGGSGLPPAFCLVRNRSYKYVKYATGEEELYDLTADPFELTNQVRNSAYAAQLDTLRQRYAEICITPPSRGGKKKRLPL